jgi:hypothetical protein
MSKAMRVGRMPDINKGIINMTTYIQRETSKTLLSLELLGIPWSINQFLGRRAEQAKMARQMEEFQSFDPHMLEDVGLKGFEHATEDEKKRMLALVLQQ